MTVPHISAPAWTVRHSRVLAPQRAGVSRSLTGGIADWFRQIAWIDVAIQLVVGGIMIALLWAVAVSGVLQRGVVSFSEWYVSDATPVFAVGTGAVMTGTDYSDGVFGIAASAPEALIAPTASAAS